MCLIINLEPIFEKTKFFERDIQPHLTWIWYPAGSFLESDIRLALYLVWISGLLLIWAGFAASALHKPSAFLQRNIRNPSYLNQISDSLITLFGYPATFLLGYPAQLTWAGSGPALLESDIRLRLLELDIRPQSYLGRISVSVYINRISRWFLTWAGYPSSCLLEPDIRLAPYLRL